MRWSDPQCRHAFCRDGWAIGKHLWPFLPSRMWRCVKCGLRSRLYDGTDWQMGRPVHPHMSVVMSGYNTVGGATSRAECPDA